MKQPLHAGAAMSALLFLGFAALMTPSCAESADSDADADPCADGQTTCGGKCIDLQTNAQHCGDCGRACAEGRACEAGECVASCSDGLARCGSSCVDLKIDTLNCGSCSVACLGGTSCKEGVCAGGCDEGQTLCGGACVDMQTDEANCGACGSPCAADRICSGGKCVVDCPAGTTDCSSQCVDTQSNVLHCGGCGLMCPSGFTCEAGDCKNPCSVGMCGVCTQGLSGQIPQTVQGSTLGTPDAVVPSCGMPGQGEVGFTFTAPADGDYVFDTQGSLFDTVLTVLDAGCAELSCNDDTNGAQSRVMVTLAAGESVMVVVDGLVEGSFVLTASQGGGSGMCDGTGDCEACENCATSGGCQNELNACDSDAECMALIACYETCVDEACILMCNAMYPNGVLLYEVLTECVLCDECPLDCDGASVGCM